jgi:hypothetical protein
MNIENEHNHNCPYCLTTHKEPPHSDPGECDLWYDWCLCACVWEQEGDFTPQSYGIGEGNL